MSSSIRTSADFIREAFETKLTKNPSYSIRAFARDTGISAGTLSRIFRKKSKISRSKIPALSKKLKLNRDQENTLRALVEFETARTELGRKKARLKLINADGPFLGQNRDRYRLIADWHHLAILELIELPDFDPTPSRIAETLGISSELAASALERMHRLGLLSVESGRLKKTHADLVIPDGTSVEAIRSMHRGLLEKASQAIDGQETSERSVSSTFMKFKKSDLSKVQERMREFRQQLMLEFQEGADHDSVYLLGMQFFSLTANVPAKPSKNTPR